jgi:hypothetical protein
MRRLTAAVRVVEGAAPDETAVNEASGALERGSAGTGMETPKGL